jgi:quinohemoprotein amine dehydrogenase
VLAAKFLIPLTIGLPLIVHSQIPVTDPLVLAKCGSCHAVDEHGVMQRISWERTTPEGWEMVIKRMIRANRVTLTPPEARSLVKYLSASHGLAPAEAQAVLYEPERRIHDETPLADDHFLDTCGKCHTVARSLSWRRSAEDWKQFIGDHVAQYKLAPNPAAVDFLSKAAPLETPEWTAWSALARKPDLTGRWLVTAHMQGHGKFCGELNMQPANAGGDFVTFVKLKSVTDGSSFMRAGRNVVYGGYEWRGRSKGINAPGPAPDDLLSEARETMWISPDGSYAEGRWFWGQYQEFGFDAKLQRAASGPSLLTVDPPSLKIGSATNRVRLIGDHFPAKVTAADLNAGPGVTVRRIVSSTPDEIVAEVDVAADAAPGKRDLTVKSATLPAGLAVFDRVDYVKVSPESSLAEFGSPTRTRGFQQFEAIGYQRGPDGKAHTADDLDLGPVPADWSMEVFYETDASKRSVVGSISPTGFFSPALESPNLNYDIWVVASAQNDRNKDGKPLVGKGYVVVTIPSYSFNGRKYVRDLDRWVEDESGTQ